MDTLTHAVSGAVAGIALGENNRLASIPFTKRALIVAIAAAAPDLDNFLALTGDPFLYLDHHRGITHSLILLPAWTALLGLLFSRLFDLSELKKEVMLLTAVGLAAHIVGDLVTAYGTMVFAPFSSARFAFPITFIIDLVFSFILVAGLVTAFLKHQVRPATISLLVLAAYLVMQSAMHFTARSTGEEYAAANGIAANTIHAYPQPLSPFRWKIVLVTESHYHRAYVDYLASDIPSPVPDDAGLFATLNASYQPVNQADWRAVPIFPTSVHIATKARKAWSHDAFASYRAFAELPVVFRVKEENKFLCVWFTDMRFALPGRKPPFSFAICENDHGDSQLKRAE